MIIISKMGSNFKPLCIYISSMYIRYNAFSREGGREKIRAYHSLKDISRESFEGVDCCIDENILYTLKNIKLIKKK